MATEYLVSLLRAFERILAFPRLGREVDHVRAGYRRYVHLRRAIHYRIENDEILIARVRQNAMRAAARLD